MQMAAQSIIVRIGLDESVFVIFRKLDPILRHSTVELEVRNAPDQLLVGDRFALSISGVWSHSILIKQRFWVGKTLHLDCTSNAPLLMNELIGKATLEVSGTHSYTLPPQEWPE